MDREATKKLALEFLEILHTRDADKVLAAMTPQPRWKFFQQEFPGPDGVRTILKAASELYRDGSAEWTRTGEYVDGDTVILQLTLRATTFKDEPYENHYVLFIHFEGDKVARVEEYMDTAYGNAKFEGWSQS